MYFANIIKKAELASRLVLAGIVLMVILTPMAHAESVGEYTKPESIQQLADYLEEYFFLRTIQTNGEIVFEDKVSPSSKPTLHIRLLQGQNHGDIHLSENAGELVHWKHVLAAQENNIESYQSFIEILQVVAESPDDVKVFDPSLDAS